MDRGYSSYVGFASKYTFRTLRWHTKQKILILFYTLAAFLGKLFFFTRPVFEFTDISLSDMVSQSNSFYISKTLTGIDGKSYRKLLLFNLIYDLFFLTGLLMILALTAALVGLGISFSTNVQSGIYLGIIFGSPLLVVLLLYFIFAAIYFSPSASIVKKNPDIDLSDLFYNCFASFKSSGKATLFLLTFVPTFVDLAIIGLSLFFLIPAIADSGSAVFHLTGVFVALALVLLWLIFVPYLFLIRRVSISKMLYDIAVPDNNVMFAYEATKTSSTAHIVSTDHPVTIQLNDIRPTSENEKDAERENGEASSSKDKDTFEDSDHE